MIKAEIISLSYHISDEREKGWQALFRKISEKATLYLRRESLYGEPLLGGEYISHIYTNRIFFVLLLLQYEYQTFV